MDIDKTSECKLAYIAGLVDGEGYITLYYTKQGYFAPSVNVCMTSIKCINFLQGTTNMGTISRRKLRETHNKQQYVWVVAKRFDIYSLLRALYPYLILKKRHADVLLEFIERRINEVPTDMYDKELVKKMSFLNKWEFSPKKTKELK